MLVSVKLEKSFKMSMSMAYCLSFFNFSTKNELNDLFRLLYFEGTVLRKNGYIFHHKLIG